MFDGLTATEQTDVTGTDAALIEDGRAIAENMCSRCHAIGATGQSPYPGAQPFRNLGQRWTHDQLSTALRGGIIAEHDRVETRLPPMKLTDGQIEAFHAYLKSIATKDHPAPGRAL
jgi:mono/diheme cytochrome c family protein